MSYFHRIHRVPPGLISQIIFAATVTFVAVVVLPATLSAGARKVEGRDGNEADHVQSARPYMALRITTGALIKRPSAGSVATSMSDFNASTYVAGAFSDWDRVSRTD